MQVQPAMAGTETTAVPVLPGGSTARSSEEPTATEVAAVARSRATAVSRRPRSRQDSVHRAGAAWSKTSGEESPRETPIGWTAARLRGALPFSRKAGPSARRAVALYSGAHR